MKNRVSKSSEESSTKGESKLKRNASVDKKDKIANKTPASDRNKLILIPITLVLAVSISWFYNVYLSGLVNTPLNAAKVINESSYKSPENLDRFWGTYRFIFYTNLKN